MLCSTFGVHYTRYVWWRIFRKVWSAALCRDRGYSGDSCYMDFSVWRPIGHSTLCPYFRVWDELTHEQCVLTEYPLSLCITLSLLSSNLHRTKQSRRTTTHNVYFSIFLNKQIIVSAIVPLCHALFFVAQSRKMNKKTITIIHIKKREPY